jgi:N-acetylmuramoyl-L-alanine amidase CwlA
MQIKDNLTNTNYNSRGTNPSWIVIHNTANGTSKAGTAYANTQYFKDVYREASAHYFVDDGDTVWRCVRDTDTAWHVGEAASRNGCYNYNAIGIEVCETASGYFTDKEISTLQWLVPMLMDKYGIPSSRVCRHHDVTGKNCPYIYSDDTRWKKLKAQILEGADVVTDSDIKKIAQYTWEYIYHQGKADEDKTLQNAGYTGLSNGYNMRTVTFGEVHNANAKLDAIAERLDAIEKKLNE